MSYMYIIYVNHTYYSSSFPLIPQEFCQHISDHNSCSLFIIHWAQLVLAWMWNHLLKHGHLLKEKRLILPQKPSAANRSSVRGGPLGASPFSMLEFLVGLIVFILCVSRQRFCEFMCAIVMACSEDSALQHTSQSFNIFFSLPLPKCFLMFRK